MYTRINISCINSLKLSVAILAVLAPLPAHSQSNEVPDDLRNAAECMLTVLKTVPEVSDPTLSYATKNGRTFPVLTYRADEKSHWTGPTQFTGTKNANGDISFMALLPGASNREAGLPDFHVTEAIEKEWNIKCHVSAFFATA